MKALYRSVSVLLTAALVWTGGEGSVAFAILKDVPPAARSALEFSCCTTQALAPALASSRMSSPAASVGGRTLLFFGSVALVLMAIQGRRGKPPLPFFEGAVFAYGSFHFKRRARKGKSPEEYLRLIREHLKTLKDVRKINWAPALAETLEEISETPQKGITGLLEVMHIEIGILSGRLSAIERRLGVYQSALQKGPYKPKNPLTWPIMHLHSLFSPGENSLVKRGGLILGDLIGPHGLLQWLSVLKALDPKQLTALREELAPYEDLIPEESSDGIVPSAAAIAKMDTEPLESDAAIERLQELLRLPEARSILTRGQTEIANILEDRPAPTLVDLLKRLHDRSESPANRIYELRSRLALLETALNRGPYNPATVSTWPIMFLKLSPEDEKILLRCDGLIVYDLTYHASSFWKNTKIVGKDTESRQQIGRALHAARNALKDYPDPDLTIQDFSPHTFRLAEPQWRQLKVLMAGIERRFGLADHWLLDLVRQHSLATTVAGNSNLIDAQLFPNKLNTDVLEALWMAVAEVLGMQNSTQARSYVMRHENYHQFFRSKEGARRLADFRSRVWAGDPDGEEAFLHTVATAWGDRNHARPGDTDTFADWYTEEFLVQALDALENGHGMEGIFDTLLEHRLSIDVLMRHHVEINQYADALRKRYQELSRRIVSDEWRDFDSPWSSQPNSESTVHRRQLMELRGSARSRQEAPVNGSISRMWRMPLRATVLLWVLTIMGSAHPPLVSHRTEISA